MDPIKLFLNTIKNFLNDTFSNQNTESNTAIDETEEEKTETGFLLGFSLPSLSDTYTAFLYKPINDIEIAIEKLNGYKDNIKDYLPNTSNNFFLEEKHHEINDFDFLMQCNDPYKYPIQSIDFNLETIFRAIPNLKQMANDQEYELERENIKKIWGTLNRLLEICFDKKILRLVLKLIRLENKEKIIIFDTEIKIKILISICMNGAYIDNIHLIPLIENLLNDPEIIEKLVNENLSEIIEGSIKNKNLQITKILIENELFRRNINNSRILLTAYQNYTEYQNKEIKYIIKSLFSINSIMSDAIDKNLVDLLYLSFQYGDVEIAQKLAKALKQEKLDLNENNGKEDEILEKALNIAVDNKQLKLIVELLKYEKIEQFISDKNIDIKILELACTKKSNSDNEDYYIEFHELEKLFTTLLNKEDVLNYTIENRLLELALENENSRIAKILIKIPAIKEEIADSKILLIVYKIISKRYTIRFANTLYILKNLFSIEKLKKDIINRNYDPLNELLDQILKDQKIPILTELYKEEFYRNYILHQISHERKIKILEVMCGFERFFDYYMFDKEIMQTLVNDLLNDKIVLNEATKNKELLTLAYSNNSLIIASLLIKNDSFRKAIIPETIISIYDKIINKITSINFNYIFDKSKINFIKTLLSIDLIKMHVMEEKHRVKLIQAMYKLENEDISKNKLGHLEIDSLTDKEIVSYLKNTLVKQNHNTIKYLLKNKKIKQSIINELLSLTIKLKNIELTIALLDYYDLDSFSESLQNKEKYTKEDYYILQAITMKLICKLPIEKYNTLLYRSSNESLEEARNNFIKEINRLLKENLKPKINQTDLIKPLEVSPCEDSTEEKIEEEKIKLHSQDINENKTEDFLNFLFRLDTEDKNKQKINPLLNDILSKIFYQAIEISLFFMQYSENGVYRNLNKDCLHEILKMTSDYRDYMFIWQHNSFSYLFSTILRTEEISKEQKENLSNGPKI